MNILDQEINDKYAIYNADCIEVLATLPKESIHLSIYSPPFCGLFQYSSHERDMSNCRSYEEFFLHYEFLVQQIARVTLPGRLSGVHCMDVPSNGANLGGELIDFPGDIIRLHRKLGFLYVGRYHVWKEPLGVRNRTMAKGLTHKQIVEDSSLCDCASADYLLMFRKKGDNQIPIAHPTGLMSYAGSRQIPHDVMKYRGWTGNQIENRYSHWIWRQYACHSSDTEVLTQNGWKLHQEVSLDDAVCCFNIDTSSQEWHHPSHVHAYPFSGDMVNINGGTKSPLDILVTPNHRMVVQPGYPLPVGSRKPHKNPRRWSFREAGTLSTSKWLVPYAIGEDATGSGGDVAFARFLGWWISEGSLAYGAPVLTQNVGRISERMRETVAEMGYDANCIVQDGSARGRKLCMHLRLRGAIDLGTWLREQCGGKTRVKHIPECAFSWSIEARQALLEALIDGDGTRYTEDRSSYFTVSCQLADDVQRLAISLGRSGRVVKSDGVSERHAPCRYSVHIGDRKYVTIQPRNFSTVPYSGMVYCLTVPTGAYVTRRNGRMAVTGNSAFWDDVRIDRVLPYVESREPEDEKHMHPLQLDVIERCCVLWSNPGENVLTPFMGVGSEVYGSVINGRRAIGIELKPSYYNQAKKNLADAIKRIELGIAEQEEGLGIFDIAEKSADLLEETA